MAVLSTIRYEHLTPVQLDAFLAQLATGHRIRVRVFVLDASETTQREISDRVISGQVDFDSEREPDRSLQLDVLDPEYKLAIVDPASAVLGGLWAGSMLRVWYDVEVPSLSAWVSTAVFTGPVQTFSRDGVTVHVQCQGKEAFMQAPNHYDGALSHVEATKGGRTTRQALSALLTNIGEPQTLDWQGTSEKLDKDFDALREFNQGEHSYLVLANKIIGPQHTFHFDGYGTPKVRLKKKDGVLDVTRYMLTTVSPSFDVSKVRNRARTVVSSKPPGTEIATIESHEPFSPSNLGRSSVSRFIDADAAPRKYRKKADAASAARAQLTRLTDVEVSLDILPIPFFNSGDMLQVVETGGSKTTFPVTAFSFPLHTGDGMSLNYTRKLLDPKNVKARFHRARIKHGRH